AVSLFEQASQLERAKKLDDPEATIELRADADKMYALSIASEWILGSYLCDLSRGLAVCIRKVVPDTPRPGGRAQWSLGENGILEAFGTLHRDLQAEIRNQLHLPSLESLFPVKQVMPEGKRIGIRTEYVEKPKVDK